MSDSGHELGNPPPTPPRAGNTGLIVAGVLGSVVVLAAGVAIGFLAGRGSDGGSPDDEPARGPATYSMSAIGNACDLVDPTPLTQWSATPKRAPEHEETPPSAESHGRLKCEVAYANVPGDNHSLNRAAMLVQAEFTDDESEPSHFCTKRKSGDVDMGLVTDIGTRGCWFSDTYGDLVANMTYDMEVQDSNLLVRVRINLVREQESPAVSWHDLDTVVRAQVQRTLDRLRQD